MKWPLNDGGFAHLKAILQTDNYRRPYLEMPPNAVEEILRIAKLHMPSTWPKARMVFVGVKNEALNELFWQKKLPPVLCLGEFVSYRDRADGSKKAIFLHIVWIQNDFLPYLNAENEAAFRQVNWEGD